MREGPIVTIDGPAGSGKSTTAREVARRLGFRHLDSGALYRALTYALLDADVADGEWPMLREDQLRALKVTLHPTAGGFEVRVGDRALADELRTADVTNRVAGLAALPAARACLRELQRGAGARGRLVADGRDMGTVVFPEAELKIYLIADLEERALRRLRETGAASPSEQRIAEQAAAMSTRDETDSGRAVSPLRMPAGALEIDTTRLTFEQQVSRVVDHVRRLTL